MYMVVLYKFIMQNNIEVYYLLMQFVVGERCTT